MDLQTRKGTVTVNTHIFHFPKKDAGASITLEGCGRTEVQTGAEALLWGAQGWAAGHCGGCGLTTDGARTCRDGSLQGGKKSLSQDTEAGNHAYLGGIRELDSASVLGIKVWLSPNTYVSWVGGPFIHSWSDWKKPRPTAPLLSTRMENKQGSVQRPEREGCRKGRL